MKTKTKLKLQRRAAQTRLAIYKGLELFPAEYLVVHQKSSEERAQKIKTEAQARRETRKKKRLFGSLAKHQRTPTSTV